MKRVQMLAMIFAAGSATAGLSAHATTGAVTSGTSLVGALFSAAAEVGIGLGRGGAQIFDATVSLMAGDWAPGDPPPVSIAPPAAWPAMPVVSAAPSAAWPAMPAAAVAPLVPAPPLRK